MAMQPRDPNYVETYYSLIQFCPEINREERVNIGVVMICPVTQWLGIHMTPDNSRIMRLVGNDNVDDTVVTAAKDDFKRMVERDAEQYVTLHGLLMLVNRQRADNICVGVPRSHHVLSDQLQQEAQAMYDWLCVDGVPR